MRFVTFSLGIIFLTILAKRWGMEDIADILFSFWPVVIAIFLAFLDSVEIGSRG